MQVTSGYLFPVVIAYILQKNMIMKEIATRPTIAKSTMVVLFSVSWLVKCLFSQIMLVGSVASIKNKSSPIN